jgi:hypothetical protein
MGDHEHGAGMPMSIATKTPLGQPFIAMLMGHVSTMLMMPAQQGTSVPLSEWFGRHYLS